MAAIVLFFEAMLGVTLLLLRRVSAVESAFQRGLMSVLNCFAGGVFITFGVLCLNQPNATLMIVQQSSTAAAHKLTY